MGSEFDKNEQGRLLKAASYGKLFLNEFDSQQFTYTCKIIRILNCIRERKIGIPLTADQFSKIGPKVLTSRLAERNRTS